MTDITCLEEAVKHFKEVKTPDDFTAVLSSVKTYLEGHGAGKDKMAELERIAYYLPNEYSDRETYVQLHSASQRIIRFLEQSIKAELHTDLLLQVLNNYYLFLENLLEKVPDKRAGIKAENLANMQIENEYDLQHLLYAYLKPLYPKARTEVADDTGYGTIRTDISLDPDHIIELKCTRPTMSHKKLIEEIEADMVHYEAHSIYFFIYDKAKIITEPQIFKETYENKLTEKQIYIIIHQPKNL